MARPVKLLVTVGIILFVILAGYQMLDRGEPPAQTRTVQLYYYNPELDTDESGNIACSRNGLVPVEREIPITNTPIQDTITLLRAGDLSSDERARGIETEYPLEGLSLKGASLNNGVLTLEFDDPRNKTGGGSCRVGILWFQIEATAKQFQAGIASGYRHRNDNFLLAFTI